MGNATLRALPGLRAATVLQNIRRGAKRPKWILHLLPRRPFKVLAIALANTIARIVYALLTKGEDCRAAGRVTVARKVAARA